jgi:hypothetical protein
VRVVGEELPDGDADLGDHGGGGVSADPRDGSQQVPPALKGLHHLLDPGVQPGDRRFQVVDVVQVQAAHQGVVVTEAAFQRHGQVRDLGPHRALGQLGQDRAAAFPVDQRLDHRPPGLGGDRGSHRVDLDPGVLQGAAEPGDLADPLLDDLGAVADHVPGGLDLRRGDEAAGQQPALQQVRQPLRVRVIFSELRNAYLIAQMSPQLRGPNGTLKARLGLR